MLQINVFFLEYYMPFLNTMVVLIIALKIGMLEYIFSILLNSKVLCR